LFTPEPLLTGGGALLRLELRQVTRVPAPCFDFFSIQWRRDKKQVMVSAVRASLFPWARLLGIVNPADETKHPRASAAYSEAERPVALAMRAQ